MDFVAYHDRTGADHQAQFDDLYPKGYRMISVSVYQPADPLYAAVWVRRPGPNWSSVDTNAAGYQAAFDANVAAGFHPTILSAAGSAADPVIAGVFEERPGPAPWTRFGLVSGDALDPNSIQHFDAEARLNGRIMTGGAVYGDAGAPMYAGIWSANDGELSWSAAGIADSADAYQQRFDAQKSGWARPALVCLDSFQRYLSIFVSDQIGPWIARHNLTSDEYQAEFDRLVPLGYYPICVQGGGSGADRRFAVLFAKQEATLARQWTSVGRGSAASVDALMRQVVEAGGVHGAGLAIVADTRLVFARGYTNAEPGYPTVLPTTPFRIASVSKTFAAVAIHQLIQEGKLALTDTMQSILNLTAPDGSPATPEVDAITVKDLLLHASPLQENVLGNDLNAANKFNTSLPVTEVQVASYLISQKLQTPPWPYNNFGYQLLGMIVARKRNAPNFIEAIRATILGPLQMTRTRIATSLPGQSFADEARYHRSGENGTQQFFDLALGSSVMTSDQPTVPDVYGNIHLEHIGAAGGLSAAVIDQARLIAAFNLDTNNPMLSRATLLALLDKAFHHGLDPTKRAGHGFDGVGFDGTTYSAFKGGYLSSSQNGIGFDLDGIGVAVCYNGVRDDVLFKQHWGAIQNVAKTATWPANTDHFPQYGMPSL